MVKRSVSPSVSENEDMACEYVSLRPPLHLDRRTFVAGSLVSGFALAAGPVRADTVIRTSAEGLETGMAQVPVGSEMMPAWRAVPADIPDPPVILVIQEIFGVHEYIKDVCRRLAQAGYMAIAPELYFRQGDPSAYDDMAVLMRDVVSKVDDQQVLSDLDAVVLWARQNGGNTERLGITGFCWGGRIAWLFCAHHDKVRAGVVWYGRLVGSEDVVQPIDIAHRLHGPVLGLYGGQDTGIPLDTVEAMQRALEQGGETAKASRIVVYPNAPHAFHADYRPSYRAQEAADGWEKALDWFEKHL